MSKFAFEISLDFCALSAIIGDIRKEGAMTSRSHWSAGERAARSRLAKLVHDESLVCGSLVAMAHACGKAGCRCARGEKHLSLALATRRGDQRVMIHVPRAWEAEVRSWVGHYREGKELLGRISEGVLKRFLREKEESSGLRRKRPGRK